MQDNYSLYRRSNRSQGKDFRPRDKEIVGERLGLLARERFLGEKVFAEAPKFLSADSDGDGFLIRFANVGRRLKSRDGKPLRELALDPGDGTWVPAEARIVGADMVRVSATGVGSPKAVRYAWSPAPNVTLVNSEDVPVGPFRSDVEK